jgi:hypothetical protein
MEKSGNGAGTTWVFNLPNGEPTRCQVEWRPSEAGQDEGKLGLQRSWKTANTKGMAVASRWRRREREKETRKGRRRCPGLGHLMMSRIWRISWSSSKVGPGGKRMGMGMCSRLFLRLWMVQSWVLKLSVGGGEVAAGKVGDRLEMSPEKN